MRDLLAFVRCVLTRDQAGVRVIVTQANRPRLALDLATLAARTFGEGLEEALAGIDEAFRELDEEQTR